MSSSVFARRAVRALCVATVLLGSVGAQSASAVTVRVDNDKAQCPNARFSRISDALAFVAPGDTVLVCPGVYVGPLRMDKPGVRLIGLTRNRFDVILVPAPGQSPDAIVEMSAPATTLAFVTLRQVVSPPRPSCAQEGVQVDNGTGPFAEASVIHHVSVRMGASSSRPPSECVSGGVDIVIGSLRGGSNPSVGRAILRDSTIVGEVSGVLVRRHSTANIHRNVIASRGFFGIGVFGASGRIQRNNVFGSTFGLDLEAIQLAGGGPLEFGDVVVGGPRQGNNIHDNGSAGIITVAVSATVANNNIHHNGQIGLDVQGTGAVMQGTVAVSSNLIHHNSEAGIFVEGSFATANQFVGNVATSNGHVDCSDTTTGTGTAGTANTWIGNIGAISIPRGICRPPGALTGPIPTTPPTAEPPTPSSAPPSATSTAVR